MMPASLRARLALLVMAGSALVWLVVMLVVRNAVLEEVGHMADARLEEAGRALMLLDVSGLRSLATRGAFPHPDDLDGDGDEPHHVAYQVWDAGGSLLTQSVGAPPAGFEDDSGFHDVTSAGQRWRTHATWSRNHGFQVRVFERASSRVHLAGTAVRRTLLPVLMLLPILGLLAWVAIGGGLAPLRALSRMIRQRGSNNLTALEPDRIPGEVRPLVDALNDLLARLSRSMEKERRFTADAAHELRTPLAGIKLQAELARSATDPEARGVALSGIVEGVNRTTRLVEQLLSLARADAPTRDGWTDLDLGEVAAVCAARYADDAVRKGVDLGLSAQPGCRLHGDATTLEALVANLVDNALRYCERGGRVEIDVRREGTDVLVAVSDNGPGVPVDLHGRLFDRFFRVAGTDVPGTGLGLSIVQRIAEAHGGRADLGPGLDGRGLGVTVRLPGSGPHP